jgi:sporulation protein YlmC with PRC-barrel domain
MMKKLAVTALAVALAFSGISSAAADSDRARDGKDRARDAQGRVWKADAAHVDSNDLIGMKVRTPDGKNAGEIDQLIVNTKDGKVTHAVIGVGGVAGIGERKVVVPWSQLTLARDQKDRDDVIVTIDRAALDRAPRYESRDRDRPAAASPATDRDRDRLRDRPAGAAADRDRDGVRDRSDRAPANPNKQ